MNKTRLLEDVSFNQMAEYAEDAEENIPGRDAFTTKKEFKTICNRLVKEFDLASSDDVDPANINRVKAYLTKEIDAASFSNGYKGQLKSDIKGIEDLQSLLIWLSNKEATTHH